MIVTRTPSNPKLVIGDYTNKSMSRIKTIMCMYLGHMGKVLFTRVLCKTVIHYYMMLASYSITASNDDLIS